MAEMSVSWKHHSALNLREQLCQLERGKIHVLLILSYT